MSRVRPKTWRWLGVHVRGQWRRLSAGLVAMALRSAVLLLPWPLKFIIDSVILHKPLGAWAAALLPDPLMQRLALLHALGAALLLLGLAEAAFAYLGNRLLFDAAQRIGFTIRRDFFAHLLRLPLASERRTRGADRRRRQCTAAVRGRPGDSRWPARHRRVRIRVLSSWSRPRTCVCFWWGTVRPSGTRRDVPTSRPVPRKWRSHGGLRPTCTAPVSRCHFRVRCDVPGR